MISSRFAPQTLNAIFLVAGTCIGGGMLALPVSTALNGFFPSLCVMLLAWLAMTCTALYLVEVGSWMKKDDAHLISMTNTFLGKYGKYISWCLYLFICYASLIAYTAGAGHLIAKLFSLPLETGCLIFMLLFGPAIFCSHIVLGRINSVLFIALIIAYVLLICMSATKIQPELLLRYDWQDAMLTLPLFLTAFSFQTMVPSLHPYLNHHAPSLKLAIIAGTTVAFVVYLLWQATVLGTVPLDGGLLQALHTGAPATHVFGEAIGSGWIDLLATFFAFFALVTSFFGISLGLYDFLADGLSIPKKKWGSVLLGVLILVPTIYGACNIERVFLTALEASGGYGDSLLNGIIPILMICVGRYHFKLKQTGCTVPGGKWLLVAGLCFYALALLIEIGCFKA